MLLSLLTLGSTALADEAPTRVWPHLEALGTLTGSEDDLETVIGLGPDVARTLWALACGEIATPGTAVSLPCREWIEAASPSWHQEEVVRSLLAGPDAETSLSARLVLVDLLAATRSETALQSLFDAFEGVPAMQLRSSRVATTLAVNLGELFAREPRLLRSVETLAGDLPKELVAALIEGVGSVSSPEALQALTDLASARNDLHREVLAQLARSQPRVYGASTRAAAAFAHRYLGNFDLQKRRLAAEACGRLGDPASFQPLVDLLEDDHVAVREAASESLQALTRRTRTWSAERWRRWYDEESDWLQDLGDLRTDLLQGELQHARLAILSIGAHPLLADETLDVLRIGLDRPEADLRVLTCREMAGLRRAEALPYLVHLLDDRSDAVRQLAHRILCETASRNLGFDSRAWSGWLRSMRP